MSNMPFQRGDVFITREGPIQIVGPFVPGRDDSVQVTDPTCHHPQDSRSGTWEIEAALLAEDIVSGDVEHGSLEVVANGE